MKGKIFLGNVPWWIFSFHFSLSDFLYYFFTRGFLRRLNIFTISYPPVILLLSLHPPPPFFFGFGLLQDWTVICFYVLRMERRTRKTSVGWGVSRYQKYYIF